MSSCPHPATITFTPRAPVLMLILGLSDHEYDKIFNLAPNTDNASDKVKLATVVKGKPKAPFSIATTLRYRGGRYSFPWITPLYPWYVPYIAEYLTRKYQVPFFKVFSMTWPGIEPMSPEPLANTLPTKPMSRFMKSKVGNHSEGWPKGSLFNSYYTEV